MNILVSILFFYNFLININANLNTNINDKLCVNCKYFISVPFCNQKFGRCRFYPKNSEKYIEYDYLVTGKRKTEYRFCTFVREDKNSCGPEGKNYITKTVLFPKLKVLKNKILNNEYNPIIFLSNLESKQQIEKLAEKNEKDYENVKDNEKEHEKELIRDFNNKIIDVELEAD